MLFHDIAKPECYSEVDGTGHAYGHPKLSSEAAKEILLRLKYDNNTIETVTQLILHHDEDILPHRKHIRRWLNKIGEKRLRQLLEVKRADTMAQSPYSRQKKIDDLTGILILVDDVIRQRHCFSLKDLAVNGRDLMNSGITDGVMIGTILNQLMDKVIDGQIENDKLVLLETADKLLRDGNGI